MALGYNVLDFLTYGEGAVYFSAMNHVTPRIGGGTDSGLTYYLDEMPVSSEIMSTVYCSNVAYIKIVSDFFGNKGGGGPAVIVYTKKGDDLLYTVEEQKKNRENKKKEMRLMDAVGIRIMCELLLKAKLNNVI